MRFLADENFDNDILSGVLRENSGFDVIRVQDTEIYEADDPTVLEWAAKENRILLTRDVNTLIGFAYDRVRAGLPMPGVIEIRQQTPVIQFSRSPTMKQITPHADRLRLARAYMDRHYDAPITLEHISSEAGFSPYHFIRLFRAVYRRTPHQYLIQQRIDKAKDLLRSSDLPIHEICYTVGFESVGSFTTLFRRISGLSPSAYRKFSARTSPATFIPLCFRVKQGLD